MDTKRKILKGMLVYSEILLMGLLQAFAYILFIVDNKFAPAGFNGIATMIQYKSGFSIGYMTLLIHVPLCLFAIWKIDKRFGINSLVFCVSNSVFYLILQQFDLSGIKYDSKGVDTIFPCIIAGCVMGFVYARVLKLSASTGGTDIIAKYICQKKPFFNFFYVNFALNFVIAFASLFVYSTNEAGVMVLDYKPVILCILYSLLTSLVGNMIIRNQKKAYLFTVVSEHTEEIEKEILTKLNHSATRIEGEGIYKNGNVKVLLCVVGRHQITDFEAIIKKYPDSFSYVSAVIETLGKFHRAH